LRDNKRIVTSRQQRDLSGYATPNHIDLRGAIRGVPLLRRGMKSLGRPRRTGGKNLLRMVRRDGRHGKNACSIRLIVMKKQGKRMNK
jgi:hypothetical protein